MDETLSLFGITEAWDHDLVAMGLSVDMLIVYTNLYVLIPWLLLKERYLLYIVLTFIFALLSALWSHFVFWDLACTECSMQQQISEFILTTYHPTLTLLGTAISLKLFKYYYALSILVKQQDQMTIDSKLKIIRSQLNAHFLLNALNNLYVLSKSQPKKAAQYLLHLSELLRYHLYHTKLSRIDLVREISFLRDYLELEKIRGQFQRVSLEVIGQPDKIKVAPLLFIPFVENAVKHGNLVDGNGFIDIKFIVGEQHIEFICTNSRSQQSLDKPSGLGMRAARQRFDTLYPGHYAIWITREPSTWTVHILLMLHTRIKTDELPAALYHP